MMRRALWPNRFAVCALVAVSTSIVACGSDDDDDNDTTGSGGSAASATGGSVSSTGGSVSDTGGTESTTGGTESTSGGATSDTGGTSANAGNAGEQPVATEGGGTFTFGELKEDLKGAGFTDAVIGHGEPDVNAGQVVAQPVTNESDAACMAKRCQLLGFIIHEHGRGNHFFLLMLAEFVSRG